jgi:hypothetical protein
MDNVHDDYKTSNTKTTNTIITRIKRSKTKPETWNRDTNYALKFAVDVFANADKPHLRATLKTLNPEQHQNHNDNTIATILEKLR